MVTLQKSGDSAVKFVFTDSDHYLYGNGELEVPVNSLLLVIDESEMVTFKKLSGDPFLSFRADNSNLGTKAAIEQFYKDNMVGSTGGGSGSGMTPSEVQEMIDESISGMSDDIQSLEQTKADTSAVTAVANDVQTVSGQVATKVAITDFNAYSAATDSRLAEDEEVTAAALNNLDENKQDALTAGQGIDITNNVISSTVNITVDPTLDTGSTNPVANSAITNAINAKVDTSAITTAITSGSTDSEIPTAKATYDAIQAGGTSVTVDPTLDSGSNNPVANSAITNAINTVSGAIPSTYISSATVDSDQGYLRFFRFSTPSNYNYLLLNNATINNRGILSNGWGGFNTNFSLVETSAITTSLTSSSTDAQVPSAKATYDAIQAGGGGGATYSAGTNISIDTANTINCTLPISVTSSNQNSIKIGDSGGNSYGNNNLLIGSSINANNSNSVGIGTSITLGANNTLGLGKNITTSNEDQLSCGFYNVSNKANSTKGDSGNTLVSVGNGYYHYPIQGYHNAFEIRQNGDLYFADTDNTTYQNYYEKPMVRLQDMYAALGGLKFVQCSQAEYDALVSGGTVDSSTIYFITNVVS